METYIVDFLNIFVGLRKVIVMLAVLVITSIFLAKGLLKPDNFEGIIKSTVIAYFGSNSLEHYISVIKEKITSNGTTEKVEEVETVTEGK